MVVSSASNLVDRLISKEERRKNRGSEERAKN